MQVSTFARNPYPVQLTPIPGSQVQAMRECPAWLDLFWKAAIVATIVSTIAVAYWILPPTPTTPVPIFRGSWFILALWIIWGVIPLLHFAASFCIALRYKPTPAPADSELPTCTLIVPAYNEGPMVRVALLSALRNNYPASKFHIIAIDDGSRDDTWFHMSAIAREFPERVTAIRHEKNGGKREALRTGFLQARGDIVITVDSDSRIDRQALRSIVAPMVADATVAAVAGKVMVLNRYENLITRLLVARFAIVCDLMRAAQARFGAVLCTPGALSAYRRSAVLEVLEKWSTQTFLGSPCTIGEDRALATWIIRSGHRSMYQSSARVHTIVPATLRPLIRMLLRWTRGDLRECLMMFPVLFTRWRKRDRWWPTFEIFMEITRYPVGYFLSAFAIGYCLRHPSEIGVIVATTLMVTLIQTFVESLIYFRSERGSNFLYGVGYAVFSFIGLQWIFPYSFFTMRDGRWMTR